MAPDLVPAQTARRFLLAGQGLLADPARRATPASVHRRIERMGFVQVDTINCVERAHHHILMSRFDDYRPGHLAHLLERSRKLFEHWTHDAAVIPVSWMPHWLHRFDRYEREMRARPYWARRMQGEIDVVLADVRGRIEQEGALRSADFEHVPADGRRRPAGFWNWKPQKAALEWLWRTGELAVARRESFQKVYDLHERVFPQLVGLEPSDEEAHVDWACRAAFERLEVATAGEVAQFMNAISNAAARAWCVAAAARGEIEEVQVEAVDGGAPHRAYAREGWRRRARRLDEAPDRTRVINPFDPVIRDRKRAQRLFGFDYKIEVFVPAAKRRYGYYVLPVLEGDRFVGRVDAKHDRDRGALVAKGLWWEEGVRASKARTRGLERGLDVLAEQIGAERVELSRSARRHASAPA